MSAAAPHSPSIARGTCHICIFVPIYTVRPMAAIRCKQDVLGYGVLLFRLLPSLFAFALYRRGVNLNKIRPFARTPLSLSCHSSLYIAEFIRMLTHANRKETARRQQFTYRKKEQASSYIVVRVYVVATQTWAHIGIGSAPRMVWMIL